MSFFVKLFIIVLPSTLNTPRAKDAHFVNELPTTLRGAHEVPTINTHKIVAKAMIRNWYNYLKPFTLDTNRKEGCTKSNGIITDTLQVESQKK